MQIAARLAALEELSRTTDQDLRIVIRRRRAELIVDAAMVAPTEADHAEEHRLRVEAADAERLAYNRTQRAKVEIVTTEPHRGS